VRDDKMRAARAAAGFTRRYLSSCHRPLVEVA
jgi:hypothetical protein